MSRNADFTPSRGEYKSLTPFRYWCQKVLPLVYDDALSYYELLCKVVDYLNKTMEDTETLNDDVTNLYTAYQELQEWVNDYYESADFEQAIDAGLDRMAESGQLTTLINAIIAPQLPDIVDLLLPETVLTLLPDEVHSQLPGVVEDQIGSTVASQIGATVAGQIGSTVAGQISPVVANQLPGVVSNQIDAAVADEIVDPVEDWLETNVGSGIAVDRTLSIIGAGADAGFTGARLETLDGMLGYEHVSDTGSFIKTANPYAFNYEVINVNADFSDLAIHTYKMIAIPVNTGDKYCINAHKISIANANENHFAVTYAFCAKHIGDPQTDIPYYLPTTYSTDDAENAIATVPEINIPTGQYYDETTGYLVVITANIEDPVYKVTEPEYLVNQDQLDDAVGEVSDALDAVSDDVDTKADKDGTYPYMTAGMAEQLLSDVVTTDKKPYLFRRTGADATREFDCLVGGSVVGNQLFPTSLGTSDTDFVDGVKITVNGDGSYTVAVNAAPSADINRSLASQLPDIPTDGLVGHKIMQLDNSTSASVTFNCGYKCGTPNGGNAIGNAVSTGYAVRILVKNGCAVGTYTVKPEVIDLTAMFGSTIADHAYTLEQATAGSGIAWLKSYGFFDGYQAYNAGSMVHVSGVEAHVMKDANDNIIGDYTLDDTLTLRGIPKLADGQMYYDGDTYAHDGTVTRKYGIRAYQAGDESLTDAITDGTNTVYKLQTPTTEQATPYQSPQICDPDGTEEYVTTGIPVGHETQYPANLKGEIERVMVQVPKAPSANGVYILQCTVSSEGVLYEWVENS